MAQTTTTPPLFIRLDDVISPADAAVLRARIDALHAAAMRAEGFIETWVSDTEPWRARTVGHVPMLELPNGVRVARDVEMQWVGKNKVHFLNPLQHNGMPARCTTQNTTTQTWPHSLRASMQYEQYLLTDPHSMRICARLCARLTALTGCRWDYGQNQQMLPANRYDADAATGGPAHFKPHRDVDLGGYGLVRTVAVISISAPEVQVGAAYTGGELVLNRHAEMNDRGYRVVHEDEAQRVLVQVPAGSAGAVCARARRRGSRWGGQRRCGSGRVCRV
jgi:hypothetical protein